MATRPYDFGSDNAAGVDRRILAALAACNDGVATAYGVDAVSEQVNARYSQVFEHECYVFACPSGTAANGLALGAITPSYGAIFCHEKSHILTTECGAPEFFSAGARLIPLAGASHKLTPSDLTAALKPYQTGNLHQLQASAISLAQATDGGTVYSCAELADISALTHAAGMKFHMDGARFTNAMLHLGCSPAEMTWKAGVDILSFGATKNGTMNVEAVIAFDAATAQRLRYMHKRAGFLISKMRFAAAQLLAYVADDLWLENAARANATAQRLQRALLSRAGVSLAESVQINQIFAHLPSDVLDDLAKAGLMLRPWAHPRGDLFRIVASFCDAEDLIARFERALSA
jgi:threonine aldolase